VPADEIAKTTSMLVKDVRIEIKFSGKFALLFTQNM
jgi:hypothetical protein